RGAGPQAPPGAPLAAQARPPLLQWLRRQARPLGAFPNVELLTRKREPWESGALRFAPQPAPSSGRLPMYRRDFLCAILGAAAFGPAFAQAWPTKPIRMIVPYPPGGANDITARIYGPHLSTE